MQTETQIDFATKQIEVNAIYLQREISRKLQFSGVGFWEVISDKALKKLDPN